MPVKTVNFEIPGNPVAKGRPRFTRVGTFVKTYTPQDTMNYEGLVKTAYGFKFGSQPHYGPISMLIKAFFAPPKSMRKRDLLLIEQDDRAIPVLKKPDVDNLFKIVSDALNGMAYKDDSQVFDGRTIKYYSMRPRVEVTITFHNEEE